VSTIRRPESLTRRLSEPLRGGALIVAALIVWTAGAAYCHGYQRLLSGGAEWPGSFLWSAVAVLPWLALFEWSKRRTGEQLSSSPGLLLIALAATAAASLLVESAADVLTGSRSAPIALNLLRRLPAIGASLVLILWAGAMRGKRLQDAERHASAEGLLDLAPSIDWIAAADNYVELHIGQRVVLMRMTMRSAERALQPLGFVRIHRRFLINRRRVESIVRTNGDRRIRIADTELPISRSYLSRLGA
jgi:hypothetical protein